MLTRSDIDDFPLFKDVEPAVLDRLCERAADITLQANEYLAHEGEIPMFFVVVSGNIEVTKHVADAEQVLDKRERGDFFGEAPLLLGSTVFANVRAAGDARVMRIDAAEFHLLVGDEPSFAAVVFRSMSKRMMRMQQLAKEIPPPPVLVVGKRFDTDCHDMRDFLSRNHIAFEYLTPEDEEAAVRIGDAQLVAAACPLVKFLDGTLMVEPSLREVAEKLGLQIEPQTDAYDVAIVGAGPAGLAAAVYGASEGLTTVLIERQAPGGQAGTSSRIENYLGFPTGISGDDLAHRALTQAERFGADVIVTRTVASIASEHGCNTLTLDGGTPLRARAVVLAMGVTWRTLDVEGVDRFVGRGVYYGAARTEAQAMRGRDVVLVGGGNSAGQAAMYFADYARSVTILVRDSELAASMSQYLMDEIATKDCVAIQLSSEIVKMDGGDRLESIDVRDNTTGEVASRAVDGVFVFIGAIAETDWLPEEIARDERGYVYTGRDVPCPEGVNADSDDRYFLETSARGIFAAGDVRHGSVKRVAAGVGEGSMAIAFTHRYLAATNQEKTPAAV
jgi:thioredoxin reductase (NADPH)